MNISFKIAQAELRTLFYSPIAWFLTIIFLVQSAFSFTDVLATIQTTQDLAGGYTQSLWNLSNKIFGTAGRIGLFGDMAQKIYLYLPLITMGLISHETSTGTIKLLYSSPVKVRQIVMGKFMAMMGYSLLLVLILFMYVLTGAVIVKSADIPALLSGLLGLFLLLCTYSAIGLFMSCLTTYQVVAALSTLVVFPILNYIGTLWQGVDFVRNLTYFLSLDKRTFYMVNGLISSKDVLYFVLITGMFLCFSYYKLRGERAVVSTSKKIAAYLFTFAGVLCLGYLSNIPRFIISYDATATKRFTLNQNTKEIVKSLGDEPLEITSYINLLDQLIWEGLPTQRNKDLNRWEPYVRAKNNIKLNYVYYYDYPGTEQSMIDFKGQTIKQVAERYAKIFNVDLKDFKSPEEIHKIADLNTENNRYVIQLKYKDKSTFLRLFNDNLVFPSETEIAAALKRLMIPLPQIVFVESEMERGRNSVGERDYGNLANEINMRHSLVNQGFDTQSISLTDQEIPANITALVIADPRKAFAAESMNKIQNYVNAGGNLLITAEPGKQEIINPVIKALGVQLMDGEMVQDNDLIKKAEKKGPSMGSVGIAGTSKSGKTKSGSALNGGMAYNMVMPALTKEAVAMSWIVDAPYQQKKVVSMKNTAALSYEKNGAFKVSPILMTDERVSWIKKKKFVADSGAVVYSAAEGDVKGSFPTALALSRKVNGKEQRIVVAGNADFLSNLGLRRLLDREQCNSEFGVGLFSWFSNGQFPIDTRHRDSEDNRLYTTAKQITLMKIVFMGVLPGLLLISGAIFLIRRRRK
jgi:ABC-2 type transport system permease protein